MLYAGYQMNLLLECQAKEFVPEISTDVDTPGFLCQAIRQFFRCPSKPEYRYELINE